MHPSNAGRVAPDRSHAGLPDLAAIEAHLTARVLEYLDRHVQPVRRGRGHRQSHRRKDARRRRPYAASNLIALLAEAIHDPRHTPAGACRLLEELKLDVLYLTGALADAPNFDDVMVRETSAQGTTDPLQLIATRTRAVGDLDALLAALIDERDWKERAIAATKLERERNSARELGSC